MSEAVVLKVLINKQTIRLFEPELLMKKKTGEHVIVDLTGLLNLQAIPGTLAIMPEMEIEIYKNDDSLPFFCGLVSYVDLKVETANTDPIERLTLKAMSYSCLYDREKKSRTFQNKAESYESVAGLIAGTYLNSGSVLAPEALGKSIGTLTVQYQETDWDFLARLASRLGLPIVASHKTAGAKFFFGTVWSSTRHQITPDEAEHIEEISQAYGKEQNAYQAFSWMTEKTEMEILDIGDIIQYNGVDFYVKEVEIRILGYDICHTYLFGAKDIFMVMPKKNDKITGLSLPGNVAKVSGNQLQVTLDLDVLSGNDCWYSYATFYSLFYCMPEKGDRVYLYFPEAQEAAAFVLTSVRVGSSGSSAGAGDVFEAPAAGTTPTAEQLAPADAAYDIQANGQVADITPYIDALADPEDGKLVDLAVSFEDGSTSSLKELVGGQSASQAGGAVSSGMTGGPASSGQSYDFESMANNEKIKVLSTSDGKKVVLNDEDGSVSLYLSDQTFIQMRDSKIQIQSSEAITFWSDGNINFNAKEAINIGADQSIKMEVKSSSLEMDCGVIKANSPNIWLGE